jgi:cytochrome c553
MTIPKKTKALGILLAIVAAPALAQQSVPKTGGTPPFGSMCVGCHGIPYYQTAFPQVYHVPKIAGQSQQYIVNALKAYKAGERSHPSMQAIAKSLSDQDMSALAAYYGAAPAEAKK